MLNLMCSLTSKIAFTSVFGTIAKNDCYKHQLSIDDIIAILQNLKSVFTFPTLLRVWIVFFSNAPFVWLDFFDSSPLFIWLDFKYRFCAISSLTFFPSGIISTSWVFWHSHDAVSKFEDFSLGAACSWNRPPSCRFGSFIGWYWPYIFSTV